jgi:hypothetical protein
MLDDLDPGLGRGLLERATVGPRARRAPETWLGKARHSV